MWDLGARYYLGERAARREKASTKWLRALQYLPNSGDREVGGASRRAAVRNRPSTRSGVTSATKFKRRIENEGRVVQRQLFAGLKIANRNAKIEACINYVRCARVIEEARSTCRKDSVSVAQTIAELIKPQRC